jgi:hypothetical protein
MLQLKRKQKFSNNIRKKEYAPLFSMNIPYGVAYCQERKKL